MSEPDFRLQITPEPTDDEAAAIAAAIALLSATHQPESAQELRRPESGWALAGRFAAHNASPATNRRWCDLQRRFRR